MNVVKDLFDICSNDLRFPIAVNGMSRVFNKMSFFVRACPFSLIISLEE